MKKEFKIILTAIIFAVVVTGVLVGIVYGLNLRDNPPVKLQKIVVNARDDKVVLTEDNASENTLRSNVTVSAKYSNGTSEIVTDYLVLNFDSGKIGEQTVTFEYRGMRAEILVEIIEPEKPLTEDDFIGTYQAEFYSSDSSIEIMKNKTYSLNTGDRTITGAYAIVDANNLTLTMNGHSLKVVIDRDNNKIVWFNVVDGVGIRRVYTHTAENGTIYRLSLFEKQLIKWDIAKDGGEYEFSAFGGYYYDAEGVFVAYCFDEEYKLVLDNDNATFKLKTDEPVSDSKIYTLQQKSEQFHFCYTLELTKDGYNLKTDCLQDDALIMTNTTFGKYVIESNVLTLLDDADKRKAILDDENGTFEFANIIYSTLHASAKDISFRFTLIDKGDTYEYIIEDYTIPTDIKELHQGNVVKSMFSDGFINIGDEENEYWVFYETNQTLVVTEQISGTYYLSTDLKTILRIRRNGSYSLTYSQNNVENGNYTIKNGRIVIDGKYVNLSGNLFNFETDNTIKMECTLPTMFLLNEVVDINSAWLTIDTVSGEHIFVGLEQTEITDLSTSKCGRFVAFIKFGDYLYRHVYEVVENEIETEISVMNFPETVQLNAGNSVLDNVIVKAITNLGNEIQVDRSLVTIENFNTEEVGEFTCTIKYGNLSLELTYEVCFEQVETSITLHGVVSTYNQNDPINLDGTYIKVYFNYGNDVSIPVTPDMVSGFTTAVRGTFVAKVTYHGFTVNFSYEVFPTFEIQSITLGEWLEIKASSEDKYENMAKVSFTPKESGDYTFISESYWDSYGYLYNEKLESLAFDDDSGENLGFKITYTLEAGKTYILAVGITNVDGKVRVLVTPYSEESNEENVDFEIE